MVPVEQTPVPDVATIWWNLATSGPLGEPMRCHGWTPSKKYLAGQPRNMLIALSFKDAGYKDVRHFARQNSKTNRQKVQLKTEVKDDFTFSARPVRRTYHLRGPFGPTPTGATSHTRLQIPLPDAWHIDVCEYLSTQLVMNKEREPRTRHDALGRRKFRPQSGRCGPCASRTRLDPAQGMSRNKNRSHWRDPQLTWVSRYGTPNNEKGH